MSKIIKMLKFVIIYFLYQYFYVLGQSNIDDHSFAVGLSQYHSGYYYHKCSGSLIDPKWVLSAARCAFQNLYAICLVNGTNKIKGVKVKEIYKHYLYRRKFGYFDLALFELGKKMYPECCKLVTLPFHEKGALLSQFKPENNYIDVGKCLPLINVEKVQNFCPSASLIGWGYKNSQVNNKQNKLERLIGSTINESYCVIRTGLPLVFEICTLLDNSTEPNKCQVDVGGPLMCQNIQYGIISRGPGVGNCDKNNKVVISTRVDAHLRFIKNIMRNSYDSFCWKNNTKMYFLHILTLTLIQINIVL